MIKNDKNEKNDSLVEKNSRPNWFRQNFFFGLRLKISGYRFRTSKTPKKLVLVFALGVFFGNVLGSRGVRPSHSDTCAIFQISHDTMLGKKMVIIFFRTTV